MDQKRYSLYFVLGLIIVSIATVSITIISSYNYMNTQKELEKYLKHNSNDTLRKLKFLTVNYIESYSVSEYENLLYNEMKNKNILAIVLEDYNMGKIIGKEYFITGKIRDKNWNITKYYTNEENNRVLNNSFYKDEVVVTNTKGTKIAKIFVYSSNKFIDEELSALVKESIISIILISMLLILISFALIQKIILKPIENIVSIITKNSLKDISLQPLPENGFKEIYELSHTMNKMIYSIQKSQEQLLLLNDSLNQKVSEKTKELQELNVSLEENIKIEIEKSKQKDILLHNQSRFASMGEMIGNIAHQWRQPLNALSITIQKVQRFYEIGKLDEEIMNKSIDKSMLLIQKMSSTIDDFMGFFRKDKVKMPFDVATAIEETITLLEASIKNNFIDLQFKKPSKPLTMEGYKGELTQVILNIISNAKDVLVENKISSPKISIDVSSDDNLIKINITDNAGGIKEDIIENIYDPYFTTKENGKGTGIGLYMSKIIIEQNMNGKLSASNTQDGACFTIALQYKE